jgi:hypothetical protein
MKKVAFFKLKSGVIYFRAYGKGKAYTLIKYPVGVTSIASMDTNLYFSVMIDSKAQEFGYVNKVWPLK